MSDVDYYGWLGVHWDASLEDIRQDYRRLARQLHPDTHWDVQVSQEFYISMWHAMFYLARD
jgi:curved DNA-binding protein CbpA